MWCSINAFTNILPPLAAAALWITRFCGIRWTLSRKRRSIHAHQSSHLRAGVPAVERQCRFAPGRGAAYYTLFSIAPLIVIAVSIAAYVFGDRAVRGYVEDQLSGIVGEDVARSIQKLVEYAASLRTGTFAPVIGLLLLVFGAIGMFLQVRGALTSIWKLEKSQAGSWLGLLIDYGLALLMVVFCGILLVASLAANILVLIFQRTLNDWMPGLPWHWLELAPHSSISRSSSPPCIASSPAAESRCAMSSMARSSPRCCSRWARRSWACTSSTPARYPLTARQARWWRF